MNQMGNNIRIARMSKGLTLQQLEMLTGIKYQLLYRYENSIQVPNNKNRSKIEKALNISLLEPSREDYEIKQLYDSFFMLLFMGERDFHEIENNIRENNEQYKKSRLYYLVLLILYVIYVLEQKDKSIHDMENKLEKMIEHDPQANCLYWQYKGVKLYHRKKYHEAEICFEKAAALYQEERYTALNLYHQFFVFKKRNQLIEAKKAIEKAKSIFSDSNALKRIYSCNMCIADIQSHCLQYTQAIEQYRACIYLAKLMHYTENYIAVLYRNIAWNYIKANRFEEALSELKKAEEIEKTNSLMILYYIYSYYRLGQIADAKEWISVGRKTLTTTEYRNILALLSGLVRSYGQIPEAKLIQKAAEIYQYYKELGDHEMILFYLDIVIELYEQKEDWQNAYLYLKERVSCTATYQI